MLYYEELTSNQLAFFLEKIWNDIGSQELPIKPPPLIFSEASKPHDYYYFSGGARKNRKWSDKEFLHRAHDAVRLQPIYKRPFYYMMAYVYYYSLKKLGKISWEKYPAPAKDWKEFIERVRAFYKRDTPTIPDWLVGAENII